MKIGRYAIVAVWICLAVTTARATTCSCNSCADCTSAIGSAVAVDTVELATDITSITPSSCIDFGSRSGVIFDGQDHVIRNGATISNGIYLGSYNKNDKYHQKCVG